MNASLFNTKSGRPSGTKELANSLRDVGAHDCDILFLHSGMGFGLPACGRRSILEGMWEAVDSLGVGTLCVPVFTFSFPNGEVFDVENTPSRMGAFSEYIRRLPGVIRSSDPLMSIACIGKRQDLVTDIGIESCGNNCTFHKLSRADGVKFAFLGVRAGDCFTYMHHLEWQARVPYRYDRKFVGRVRYGENETDGYAILYVRYKDVIPSDGSYRFEEAMLASGVMKGAKFGDGFVRCVAEKESTSLYMNLLAGDPYYFITEPFDISTADKAFAVDGVMVAM